MADAPLTPEAQLQNRLDCLGLILNDIAVRCATARAVVDNCPDREDAAYLAAAIFQQIGAIADRAKSLVGSFTPLADPDEWLFGSELAISIAQARADHG